MVTLPEGQAQVHLIDSARTPVRATEVLFFNFFRAPRNSIGCNHLSELRFNILLTTFCNNALSIKNHFGIVHMFQRIKRFLANTLSFTKPQEPQENERENLLLGSIQASYTSDQPRELSETAVIEIKNRPNAQKNNTTQSWYNITDIQKIILGFLSVKELAEIGIHNINRSFATTLFNMMRDPVPSKKKKINIEIIINDVFFPFKNLNNAQALSLIDYLKSTRNQILFSSEERALTDKILISNKDFDLGTFCSMSLDQNELSCLCGILDSPSFNDHLKIKKWLNTNVLSYISPNEYFMHYILAIHHMNDVQLLNWTDSDLRNNIARYTLLRALSSRVQFRLEFFTLMFLCAGVFTIISIFTPDAPPTKNLNFGPIKLTDNCQGDMNGTPCNQYSITCPELATAVANHTFTLWPYQPNPVHSWNAAGLLTNVCDAISNLTCKHGQSLPNLIGLLSESMQRHYPYLQVDCVTSGVVSLTSRFILNLLFGILSFFVLGAYSLYVCCVDTPRNHELLTQFPFLNESSETDRIEHAKILRNAAQRFFKSYDEEIEMRNQLKALDLPEKKSSSTVACDSQ